MLRVQLRTYSFNDHDWLFGRQLRIAVCLYKISWSSLLITDACLALTQLTGDFGLRFSLKFGKVLSYSHRLMCIQNNNPTWKIWSSIRMTRAVMLPSLRLTTKSTIKVMWETKNAKQVVDYKRQWAVFTYIVRFGRSDLHKHCNSLAAWAENNRF